MRSTSDGPKLQNQWLWEKINSALGIEGNSLTRPFCTAFADTLQDNRLERRPQPSQKNVSCGVHTRLHRCIKETQTLQDSSSKGLRQNPAPKTTWTHYNSSFCVGIKSAKRQFWNFLKIYDQAAWKDRVKQGGRSRPRQVGQGLAVAEPKVPNGSFETL